MIAVLFIILVLCLFIGVPVGFSIGISAMSFLAVSQFTPVTIMAQRLVDGLNSFPLLALPFFILAGEIMSYGCTPRLMRLANLFLGKKPGGLCAAGITASAFFGAISGSGVACTAAIGGIVGPDMAKNGYKKGYTASVIAASGTLGIVIPPSLPMVIYGTSSGTSIRNIFMAGIVPGLLAIGCLLVMNRIISGRRGYGGQAENYTKEEKRHIIIDAIPSLMMPLLVLGGVLLGIMTPTESAVIAVVYAFILAFFVYRELKLKDLLNLFTSAAVTTSVIMLIIGCAAPFGWLLAINNVPNIITEAILGLSTNPVVIMALITVLLLFLGTFMETISIIVLLTPMLLPVVTKLGFSPVHFGVILILNLAIGGTTPPLAVCLFTACRILGIQIDETFPDILYIVGTLILCLILIIVFPAITVGLPNLLIGS